MDPDLRRLREFGETLKPRPDQLPERLRGRVMASIGAISPPAPVRKPLRRWRIAGLTAGALAACAALMMFTGSGGLPPYPLEKTHMLKLAVEGVAAAPVFAPRPDQFIYTESIAVYRELRPASATVRDRRVQVRAWRSVDGNHDGLVQTLLADTCCAQWQDNPIPVCQPDSCRAALSAAGLPTDPDAMYRYLYRADANEYTPQQVGADERALSRAGDVLRLSQHLPAVQAALFKALARVPGVSLRLHGLDVAGRQGIALTYTGKGNETELIFEPGTYKYLGVNRKMTWIYLVPELERPDRYWVLPDEAIQEAVTRVAVVDRVGQR